MTALDDDLREERTQPNQSVRFPGPWRAKIAVPPASGSAMLYVTIPEFDPTRRFGPCRWAARGALLPVRGNDCIVMFDNLHDPWVVVWWP